MLANITGFDFATAGALAPTADQRGLNAMHDYASVRSMRQFCENCDISRSAYCSRCSERYIQGHSLSVSIFSCGNDGVHSTANRLCPQTISHLNWYSVGGKLNRVPATRQWNHEVTSENGTFRAKISRECTPKLRHENLAHSHASQHSSTDEAFPCRP